MLDHAFLVVDDNDLDRISYTAALGAQWTPSQDDRGFNRTTHVLSGGAGGNLSFSFNGVVTYLVVCHVCLTYLSSTGTSVSALGLVPPNSTLPQNVTCAVDGISGTPPPNNVPPSSYFTQLPYCDFSGLSMDQEHTLVISSISDFNLDSILYTIPKNPSRRATPPLSPAHFLIDDTRIDRIKYDSGWQPETIPAHFDFNKTLTVSFGKNIASSFNFQGMYTIYNVIFGVLGLVRHIPFPL
jgi:hypothetical protein